MIDTDSDCSSIGPFSPTLSNVSLRSHTCTPELRDENFYCSDSNDSHFSPASTPEPPPDVFKKPKIIFNAPTSTASDERLRDENFCNDSNNTPVSTSVTPEPPPDVFKKPKNIFIAPTTSTASDDQKKMLLLQVQGKISLFVRSNWTSVVDVDGIHILMLSKKFEKSVQRRLYFSSAGDFQLSVHCKPINDKNLFSSIRPKKALTEENLDYFVDRIADAVNCICNLEICTGVSCEEFKLVWHDFSGGVIDKNPYQENRYSETCRSHECELLVTLRSWRCKSCTAIYKPLQRKAELDAKETLHPNVPNAAMPEKHKNKKLINQQKLVKSQRRKLDRQATKIQELLAKEAVLVDKDTSDDFLEILSTADLTEEQSLFLQQQMKASKVKKACGMRWHPTMIRFALQIYMNSKKVYASLQQTGMIRLPSQRTLFDYSHVKPVKEGVDYTTVEFIHKRIVQEFKEDYQKYHVLMCDEMYISKNLVYEKSTGRIVGFANVSEVREELQALKSFLNNEDPSKVSQHIASKILSFMVKGVATNVKEVVASFTVDQLTKEHLYAWSWEVIGKLEAAGVEVIAFVMDGSSVNRAFIKMHTPVSETESEVVYDTMNKAAPHRVLYFISDVPHLLKTIRNCFQRSTEKKFEKRNGKVIWKRCMQKNGQYILWKTIVRIYNTEKDKPLRQCYKLNANTVFLNAYSCMNVSLAGHVLSSTVANYLQQENWPNTSETANFIRKVNDWFDMMNGNYFTEGQRKRNPNLDPYEDKNDPRFQKLEEFLEYLREWKHEAEFCAANETMNRSVVSSSFQNNPDDPDIDPSAAAVGLEEEDEMASPASMRQLSYQTIEGIEIAVRGFTGAVQFLLGVGVKKINARVFCQDPIEQFFSKQRYKCGRNPSPTVQQFLRNQGMIHTQGEMGSRRCFGKGNTQLSDRNMEVTYEPLPKRKSLFSITLPVE
ncbi:uncharacterized protein LOC127751122 [Frankliniella occidentalis]|uniref:Uncharacterized protein LOC127751122 n=1 Tax=Frankliniella occidentalis TaxID=133901 RepID=A0A9C6X6L7_FRAOC|nr:uncharacterized protein LOC127751122 [Frankliniella occidentalis]